jgi:acyl-CoA synthetase (AMP-forming)/AMP-acid ligase II
LAVDRCITATSKNTRAAAQHLFDSMRLYERWRQVVKESPKQVALVEAASGLRWTFEDLAAKAEGKCSALEAVVFPCSPSVGFILTILYAWRTKAVVCPLEPGQAPPPLLGGIPQGVVHLKTTSASTGKPRMVAFTAEQLEADTENIVATMGLHSDCPNIAAISLAHSYGFSNLVLPLLLKGIPLILAEGALPESLRHAAALAPGVSLPAVPALWQTWHDAEAIPTNVRLAISAGAPLPLALEKSVFERSGLKIHNFYGSSECGGIAFDGTARPRSDQSLAGAPLSGVNVLLGMDGCVIVRSAAVAEGYWPDPEPVLGSGVFRTSDLGQLVDGCVHLRGRASDQINIAGRKVSPDTIELVLASHPKVRGCVAFGVPGVDAQRGEVIVACVSADAALEAETLRQFALSTLPAWQVPREWWFVSDLQTNGRGKLSRAQWRQRFLEKNRNAEDSDSL